MRPLFWTPTKPAAAPWLRAASPSRVSKSASSSTLWDSLTPQEVDLQSFEALFSQKAKPKKKVMDDKTADKATKGIKPFNALDGKRAQAVGILMGSLKVICPYTFPLESAVVFLTVNSPLSMCTQMGVETIEKAVLGMDESILELEQLKAHRGAGALVTQQDVMQILPRILAAAQAEGR